MFIMFNQNYMQRLVKLHGTNVDVGFVNIVALQATPGIPKSYEAVDIGIS